MSATDRRRDAALAATLGGIVVVFAPLSTSPLAVVAGALGTLAIESLLSRRPLAVRRVWGRKWIQATAFVGALLASALLSVALGPAVWTAVVAGCVAYLVVLGGAELRSWR